MHLGETLNLSTYTINRTIYFENLKIIYIYTRLSHQRLFLFLLKYTGCQIKSVFYENGTSIY
ncbi:hypothetical protein BpHYR1_047186 [Brachionus plicatilis]|uniref:Uncharacterized protein n=1 Tax=Brachionus plicatilis TaxID=10195 RepID=A0A3M7S1Y9_BRAPC|nr:hypothetical protein BpHYR1_047186 [Brachionus plicatilis]